MGGGPGGGLAETLGPVCTGIRTEAEAAGVIALGGVAAEPITLAAGTTESDGVGGLSCAVACTTLALGNTPGSSVRCSVVDNAVVGPSRKGRFGSLDAMMIEPATSAPTANAAGPIHIVDRRLSGGLDVVVGCGNELAGGEGDASVGGASVTGPEGSGSVGGGGSPTEDGDGSFVSTSSGIDKSGIDGFRPTRISRSDFMGGRGPSLGIS